jgi:hypothetical protein
MSIGYHNCNRELQMDVHYCPAVEVRILKGSDRYCGKAEVQLKPGNDSFWPKGELETDSK